MPASQRWQRMIEFDRIRLGMLRQQLHQRYLKRHNRAELENLAPETEEGCDTA